MLPIFEKLANLVLSRKSVITFFTALFLIIVAVGFLSPKCAGGEKLVVIEKGLGSDETAQKLKDEGLIGSKWFFVFYVWIKGYGEHLQAGEYLLDSKMSVFEIAKIIANGEVAKNYAKVTIPEGWDIKKIEARLRDSGVLAENEKIPQSNEGYLFPDTYYFERNSSAEAVVEKMRDNFMRKISGISKDLLADSSMRLPNAIIMASIIEKEVVSEEDRAIVSGVFWKRIESRIPLQSCATIAYVLGVDKKQYTYEDTRVKSPYNTYINLGLPPAPINNPGLSAIKAALSPQKTDYWYFLSTPDGTTIFSKTIEEHNANKAKYLDN